MNKAYPAAIAAVIIVVLIGFIFFQPRVQSEKDLQKVGITDYCGAQSKCLPGYSCFLLPVSNTARCVPDTMDLCRTFCGLFRDCSIIETLPAKLACGQH